MILLAIAALVVTLMSCSNKPTDSVLSEGWQSETVDDKFNAGAYSSLAIDKNSIPHIAYYSGEALKYAFRNNARWSIQIIEAGIFAGQDPKIKLDSYGRPHISYFFYNREKNIRGLKYAHWTGSEWKIIFIDEKGANGSIAIDSKNRPHIAYSAKFGNGLGYAYWDGEKWYKQFVNVLGDQSQYKELTPKDKYFGRTDLSLVLDDDDKPHVAYFQRESEDLRYICLLEDKWNIQVIDNEGLVGLSPSIAVDRKGRVHITYLHADDYDLKYAYWDGGKWNIQIIDEEKNIGCDSIVVLDKFEKPHVVYQRCADEELKYAFFDGTNWNVATVEARKIGWNTAQSDTISMVLDAEGNPHISCYDNHKKSLKYIVKYNKIH